MMMMMMTQNYLQSVYSQTLGVPPHHGRHSVSTPARYGKPAVTSRPAR